MQKKFITLMAVAGLAVTAGSAFAAATLDAGNTTIAQETLQAGVPAAVPATVAYTPSQIIAGAPAPNPTTTLKVTTTGTFAAAPVGWALCASLGNPVTAVPGPATAEGDTSFNLVLTQSLNAGQAYNLSNDGCTSISTNAIEVPADSAVNTSVAVTIDNANLANDPKIFATGTVATIKKQFSAVINPVTSIISFDDQLKKFRDSNGKAGLPPFTTAQESVAGFTLLSDETLGTKVQTGLVNNSSCGIATLNATDLINVKVAGNFTEVGQTPAQNQSVQVIPVKDGAEQAPISAGSAVKATDTSATVAVPGDQVAVCGTSTTVGTQAKNENEVKINVSGTNVLVPRNFTTAVTFKGATSPVATPNGIVNTAANIGPLATATTSHIWVLDTTSYVAPFVKFSPDGTQQSYFKLTFKGATGTSAPLTVNVVGTDGQLHALPFGTLPAGQTVQITAGDIVTAATTAGVTLGQVNGVYNFPATFQIQATEADSYAYGVAAAGSFFTRIPMKVNGGTIVE